MAELERTAFEADLEHDKTLIVSESDLVTTLPVGDTPTPLQAVAQGRFQPIRRRVPELDGTILGSGDDERERRVEDGKGNVGSGRIDGLNTRLVLVVPNLDGPVLQIRTFRSVVAGALDTPLSVPLISARDQIRLVTSMVIVYAIDSLLVSVFQGKVGSWRAKRPDFDGVVETCRRKDLGVFRVL